MDGEGDAVLVADAPDEVDSEEAVEEELVDDAEQVDDAVPAEVAEPSDEVVAAEPDATAVAIERPTTEAEPSVDSRRLPLRCSRLGQTTH